MAENRLLKAERTAEEKKVEDKMEFICSDIDSYVFPENHFDIVLFNASLHHFNKVERLLSEHVINCLNNKGLLVINEYVGLNSLQFKKNQIKAINKALESVPDKYRTRFRSRLKKRRFSGYGVLRMIISDPSECIDSENIIPSIHKYYNTILERPFGGNLLMHVLMDISHHFVELNDDKKDVLNTLFDLEDDYLKQNASDFVFGVYEKSMSANNKATS